ncbi:hypothetical protein EON67_04640 [archaeon]|nr:MAG: hypothetical protein EON67_04640 [archaeon]
MSELEGGEFLPVTVTGVLDTRRTVYVCPRPAPKNLPDKIVPPYSSNGMLALTPLVRPDGSEVLVMQGWWPAKGAPPRSTSVNTTPVTLRGVLRAADAVRAAEPPTRTVCV